jgi:Tfp pilus assembly protein PilZ
MTNPAEKRKFKRVNARVAVEVKRYSSEEWKAVTAMAYSKNISANGVLVPSVEEFPIGSYVSLSFALPGEKRTAEFFGKVVRVERKSERSYLIGVSLLEAPKGAITKINKYVTTKLS